MEGAEFFEYVFKGVVSLGVGTMVFILKDFKVSLNKLSDSLAAVTLSLNSLVVKDEHKAEKLLELKLSINKIQHDIAKLQVQVFSIKHKESKPDN